MPSACSGATTNIMTTISPGQHRQQRISPAVRNHFQCILSGFISSLRQLRWRMN